MSIDSPFSGKIITDLWKNQALYKKQWSNILVDAATNEFGIPAWLTYITRLADKESPDWTFNQPISYNLSFPNVVWPDNTTSLVLKQLYMWVDWKKQVVYEP